MRYWGCCGKERARKWWSLFSFWRTAHTKKDQEMVRNQFLASLEEHRGQASSLFAWGLLSARKEPGFWFISLSIPWQGHGKEKERGRLEDGQVFFPQHFFYYLNATCSFAQNKISFYSFFKMFIFLVLSLPMRKSQKFVYFGKNVTEVMWILAFQTCACNKQEVLLQNKQTAQSSSFLCFLCTQVKSRGTLN